MIKIIDVCECGAPVTLTALERPTWRVQHGPNPEHARDFTFHELTVTTGWLPWAREIHARVTL